MSQREVILVILVTGNRECQGSYDGGRTIGEAGEIKVFTCDGCGEMLAYFVVRPQLAEGFDKGTPDEEIFRQMMRKRRAK